MPVSPESAVSSTRLPATRFAGSSAMPSHAPTRASSVGSSFTICGVWSGLPSHAYSAQPLTESSVSPVPAEIRY